MVYKIRIILDSEEDIFRDLEVESNSSLEAFHDAINQAFGFLGNEMASFYTCDENWNQDEEIPLFSMEEDTTTRSMGNTLLEDVMTQESPKLIYLYDYLNMWTFFVELADIVLEEAGQTYPVLLFSFGNLPDTPPAKNFNSEETKIEFELEEPLDSYEDLDFDENWN